MAVCCDNVQLETMRDTTSINTDDGVDSFDSASHSREDDSGFSSDFFEERFRVDRKKLEEMLIQDPEDVSGQNEKNESAKEFFERIMAETSTQITWPSKLKIGAKSKKDPHIKVIGFPDDVKAAKAKIMSVLDTKTNRVTLKMDVSHTEHSHVIGKRGYNIQRVMIETGCHIHFPDSNRNNKVQEKSNQVSIAGQAAGVESARIQIRELLPLVFTFEVSTSPILIQKLLDMKIPVEQIQCAYNVTITLKQRPLTSVLVVSVRGSILNAKSVKEATAKLMESLTGTSNGIVSMNIEIAPQHHQFIIGRQACNVKSMMQSTNSSILFPEPPAAGQPRKSTVVIKGSIESVFCARQLLIDCLPLVLMFDIKEDTELDQGRLAVLMDRLDVLISVKPKPKQPSKSVIVKSVEKNAHNMYLARLLLLGLHPEGLSDFLLETATNTTRSSAGLGFATLGDFRYLSSNTLLHTSPPSPVLVMNGHPSSCLGSSQSPSNPAVTQWLHGGNGLLSPVMMVPHTTTRPIPASLDVLPQCNGYHNDYVNSGPYIRVPTPQNQGSSGTNSECTSPSTESSSSSPHSAVSFRHGPPVELGVLQSEDTMENVITRDPSAFSSSGHTLDLLGLSKTTPNHQTPPVTATLFSGMSSRLQSSDKSPESSGAESDGSDKLAPGSERKKSASPFFSTPLPFPFDYEQKKLLAIKAMQENPKGESRIPTDMWSGMGFSKSMPESVIRDRLDQLEISHSRFDVCNTLPAPDEYVETPLPHPDDVDRDPWKDSKTQHSTYLNKAPGEFPYLRRKPDYEADPQAQHEQYPEPQHCCPEMIAEDESNRAGLADVLRNLQLLKYLDLFQQQEIDLATFKTLTDQDLKELGITTFGARRKMLLAIADLNKGHTLLQQAHCHPRNNLFQANSAMSSPRRPDIASLSGRW